MDPGHITSMAIIGIAVHYEDGDAPDPVFTSAEWPPRSVGLDSART